MSAGFGVSIIVMVVLAIGFVAVPLTRQDRRIAPACVALAVPLFSVGLYLVIGSPQAAAIDVTNGRPWQASNRTSAATSKPVGSVASMVEGLAVRLEGNPGDVKSWLLLARSYKHLNRLPEAQAAYQQAAALGEYDDELAALSKTQAPDDSARAQISGSLKLSERTKTIINPTDTVFIFARAISGPPMPVAVLQRAVSDLPLDFNLNDSHAMSADATLSNFEMVVVTARISRSGVATDALKDLEARSDAVAVSENKHLNLTIQ